jgi:hypothetical protein
MRYIDGRIIIKLCDFGSSTNLKDLTGSGYVAKLWAPPELWTAPEGWYGKLSTSSDVW